MKHYLLTLLATLIAVAAYADATPKTVPYESTMTDPDEWIVHDLNEDNKTWEKTTSASDYTGSGYSEGLKYSYHNNNAANDWVVSPPIHLEPGNEYKVTHWGRRQSTSWDDQYKLYFGTSSQPAELLASGTMILDANNLPTTMTKYAYVFSVEQEGDYYFGFYNYSPAGQFYCYITGFKIDFNVLHPGAATGLTATPGEEGAMTATLSWTWPTIDEDGAAYNGQLIGAYIYRSESSSFVPSESNRIGTYTPQEPIVGGQTATWTDETLDQSGKYYYIVRPFDANGESGAVATSANCWVGPDTKLTSVTNTTATVDPENSAYVLISFDPSKGANGGYIVPGSVGYDIIRYKGSGYSKMDPVTIVTNYQGELPYRDQTIPEYSQYSYEIQPKLNGENSGSTSSTSGVTAGPAITVPYYNNFDGGSATIATYVVENEGTSSDVKWKWESDKLIVANDYSGTAPNTYIFTPPITFEAGKKYVVKFDAWGYNRTSSILGDIFLYIGKNASSTAIVEPYFGNVTVPNETLIPCEFEFTVPEDGAYVICLRDYYAQKVSVNSKLYVDNLEILEKPEAPLAPTGVKVTADATGQLKAKVEWTNPSQTNLDNPLSALSKVEVYRQASTGDAVLVGTVSNPEVGGNSEYTDDTIETKGYYTYTLKPYMGDVTYDYAVSEVVWVGEDDLAKVRNLVALPSRISNAIEVSFDVPQGTHGGYANLEGVTYKIVRSSEGDEDVVVADSFVHNSEPFVDSSVRGLKKYKYSVYTVKDGVSATSGEFVNVVGGGVLDLPYEDDFSTNDYFSLYTIKNGETGNNATWSWSSYSKKLEYYKAMAYNGPNDSYAILPPMDFAQGTYRITFNAQGQSPNVVADRSMEILMGIHPTIQDLTRELQSVVIPNVTDITPFEVTFEVQEAGRYNLALRATGDYGSAASGFYITSLNVERFDRSPLAATDLEVTPAEGGSMSAVLSWTNPSTDNKGDALTEITKLVVMRDGEEISLPADINLTPGAENTITDVITDGTPGFYNYSIAAYLGMVEGRKAYFPEKWIGEDVIMAPENFKVATNLAGERTLTWDAITSGKNGGYLNPEKLSYTVLRNDTELASGLKTAEYFDNADVDFGKYTYGVKAVYGDTESATVTTGELILGSTELPYSADFSKDETCDDWMKGSDWGWKNKFNGSLESKNGSGKPNGLWTMTPPFSAQEGILTVNLDMAVESTSNPKVVEVYLITDRSDYLNATEPVFSYNVTKTTLESNEFDIIVPASGIYSLAFKALSSNSYFVYIAKCDIEQSEVFDPNRPVSPSMPASVTVTKQDDGSRLISFEEVTTDVKGQTINDVTYRIYRNDDVLASNLANLSYTDSDEVPLDLYTYGVQAVRNIEGLEEGDEISSKVRRSDYVIVGDALELPYYPDFTNEATFNLWDLPGSTPWKYDSSAMALHSTEKNAWAATPPFKANRGELTATIEINANSYYYAEKAEVYIVKDGEDYENGEYLTTIEATSSTKTSHDVKMNILEDATYRLALKNGYGNSGLRLYKTDIVQTFEVEPGVIYNPKAPSKVTVKVNTDDTRLVTFDAVTTDIYGNEIEGVTYNIYRNNSQIATGVTLTEYVDDEEIESGNYVYGVSSVYEEDESDIANSPSLKFAPALSLPYSQPFTAATDFDAWTLQDWSFKTTNSYCPVNSLAKEYNKLAVATTSPFKASRGKIKLTVGLCTEGSSSGKQDLDIYFTTSGGALEEAAIVKSYRDFINKASNVDGIHVEEIEIDVPEDGVYSISFKALTSDYWYLYLTKCDIEQTESIEPDATYAPAAPENVVARILDNGDRQVTFDAVTTNINDFDIDGVTYNVYRNEEMIASGIAATEYTDDEADLELGYYVYGVEAVIAVEVDGESSELASEISYAAPLLFGAPYELPYEQAFDSEDDFEFWTFVHEDGKEDTWEFNDEKAAIGAMETGSWAVTPPFKAQPGTCKVAFTATCGGDPSLYADVVEVYLMKNPSDREGALKIASHDIETETPGDDIESTFSIEDDATYHIAYRLATDLSVGCHIYKTVITQEDATTDGIGSVIYAGNLAYDKATQTLLIPAPGRLEVFTTNGMRMVAVDTADHVNISALPGAAYVARFIDRNGNAATLKFVK